MSSDCTGSGDSAQQNGINGGNATNSSPKKKYTLSADAPVFVPKYAMQQQYYQPPQSTDFAHDAYASQAQNYNYNPLANIPSSNNSGVTTSGTDNPVDMFRNAVITLTTKGNVEEYMKPIVDNLKRGVTDMAVLNEIIEILFEHSINEVNFSYTGAQICKYLSNELKSHHVFNNFRGLFLNRCKSAYDNRDAMIADPATFPQITNLAMLIGQLFLVLEVDVDGQLQKLGFLRQAISNLLLSLLSNPDDERVKCAAQLLKLTGFEITKNAHLPGEFEEVYNIIRSLEKHPSLNRTSHCLINSVLSRLEYNWGVEQVS